MIQILYLEHRTIAETPRSCNLDLVVEWTRRNLSTTLTATWNVREENSFMAATSANQSTRIYLQEKCTLSYDVIVIQWVNSWYY